MRRDPFPHQTHGLELLRQSLLAGRRRPMLSSPTGSGKTKLASMVVEGALRKSKRVVFVVPAVSLIDQTVERFYAEGIDDMGVIQARHEMTDWSKPVQIASVQTLQNRTYRPEADVVVIDEAHHLFEYHRRWMSDPKWAKIPFIGLSATPWTKGLGKHFDDLITVTTTAELIEAGFLSPFRVFAPSHPDLSKVRVKAGDFREDDLSEAMSPLVADVVQTWVSRGEGRPTLCFAVDRAHAKKLQGEFLKAGVATDYIDAYTDVDERKAVEKRLARGETKVACNVGCLTTGVDWDVRCIILARPTKSEMLFVQIIGRGLRTAQGKADCLVLDHSDTHARLGFVTDIHHAALDGGKHQVSTAREREVPMPKECQAPGCHFLRPAKVSVCPACGFKAVRQSEIKCEDGELTEMQRERGRAQAARVEHATKQRWFSMLLYIARKRGYQEGWADNKYREKFEVWPRGLVNTPVLPDAEVEAWVQHAQIKWARRRAA